MTKRTCTFPGCDNPHSAHGYCAGHNAQLKRGLELRPLRSYGGGGCSIGGCPEPLVARGWCAFHYERWHSYGDPLREPLVRLPQPPMACDFTGCTNLSDGPGYCLPHKRQLWRGKELRPLRSGPHGRKYVIDHHFFDQVDTEEKAYWLGFIAADGCVGAKNRLMINLQATDAGHLMKLNVSLSSDYPVRIAPSAKSSRGMARWAASSTPLVNALNTLGIVSRKSVIDLHPWDGPTELMRHYWRGMVDGDGGMSPFRIRPSRPKDQWRVFLTGSRSCVEAFAAWASAICGSRARPVPMRHSRQTWMWTVGGIIMARLVVAELYGGCTVSLDRKQALADTILGWSTGTKTINAA